MQVQFSNEQASDARFVAFIIDQGAIPAELDKAIREGAAAARFTGATGQVFDGFADLDGKVVRIALAGAGKQDSKKRTEALEKAGAALAAKYFTSGEKTVTLDVTNSGLSAGNVASVLLGLRLRCWRHDLYRTKMKDEQKRTLESVTVVGAVEGSEAAWTETAHLADGVEFARELVTEPANVVYPESFVERCKAQFDDSGAELVVLDDDAMEKLGMHALLGVGLGSERPSRLLAIVWRGGKDGDPFSAFVGKGVTFDTGGISIKPAAGMEDMKWDMGGSASVAGGMLALVRRKAKANIVGVVGLVENMPDGRAQRPGDVVTSMSGQTIEVINTDAEGRLVLCDALHWVQQEYEPARIVDFATLTGAMIISLGHEHAGVFSNDDDLADGLLDAAKESGDKLWRLPLAPAYDKLIDSPIADMKNVGPRGAGSITAAQFLQRFIADGTPWAHCDIAGMAWADKPGRTWGKGATGYGVRLIDSFVANTVES